MQAAERCPTRSVLARPALEPPGRASMCNSGLDVPGKESDYLQPRRRCPPLSGRAAILVGVSGPLSSAAALPRGVGIGFGDERGIDGGIGRLLCLGLLGGPRSSAPLCATFTAGGGGQGWGD
jgi:hypothetical protein